MTALPIGGLLEEGLVEPGGPGLVAAQHVAEVPGSAGRGHSAGVDGPEHRELRQDGLDLRREGQELLLLEPQPGEPGGVAEALEDSGVDADSLWFEITETALLTDARAATTALREVEQLGVHIAVDDFGTGYSSLTYLKRFPVEAIKIDRSFVAGLGIDDDDSTIVEAVVQLGRSLGVTVVAEGVESPLQLSRLRELNCDRGQGYLFGRPRPAEIIVREGVGG